MALLDIFYEIFPTFKSEVKYYVSECGRTPGMNELNDIVDRVKEEIRTVPHIRRLLQNIDDNTIEDLFSKIDREIKGSIVTTNESGTVIKKLIEPSWITEQRMPGDVWNYWKRYITYLKRQGRAEQSIHELDKSTLTILELLGDPQSSTPLFKKGVVVGNVQSGKTSNFNGVINRAIDAGYKLVIVLSGIMDDLRSQTQDRIEKDVIGWGTLPIEGPPQNGIKGVGKVNEFGNNDVRQIEAITSMQTDFSRSLLQSNFSFANPKILICKKNHNVLANLLYWISSSIPEGQSKMNIPLLVLDDEADNASLNNLGRKGQQYATKINGHIRALLNLFSRKSYLGYTATPFANILQDQQEKFEGEWKIKYRINGEIIERSFELTGSLFPDDFIYKLTPPSNYVGPKIIFENGYEQEGDKKLPLISTIADFLDYFPEKAKRTDTIPPGLPPSLSDAIDCFILSIALRLSRENLLINSPSYNPHHSMLVHVSKYTNWQNSTADEIKKYLQSVINNISNDEPANPVGIYSHFEKQWNRYFAYEVENIRSFLPPDYFDPTLIAKKYRNEILSLLPKAVEGIEVKAVNSERKEHLSYVVNTQGTGKKYIAVGGNRLSRGFTLEGLTINYFIRDSNYYDALLQMGRWFGYRPGYIDGCRLFISKTTREHYNFITRTITELDELFEVMNKQVPRRTPKDFELRIRKHHGTLKITRPSILKGSKDIKFTFQDETIETYRFLIEDGKLKNSWKQFRELVQFYKNTNNFYDDKERDFYVIKTDVEGLLKFLNSENSFISTESFVLDDIIKYINLANKDGYLKHWTIGIQKTGKGNNLKGEPLDGIQLSIRKGPVKGDGGEKGDYYYNLLNQDSIFVAGGSSTRVISSGKDESINLESEVINEAEEEFRENKTKEIMEQEGMSEVEARRKANAKTLPGWIYRKRRNSNEGLMLVYLIDMKNVLGNDSELSKKVSPEIFDKEKPIPLIGYAFSIPPIAKDPGGEYKANEVSTEDFGAPVVDELETIENTDEPVTL